MRNRLGKTVTVVALILAALTAGFLVATYQTTAAPVDSYNVAWQLVRNTATEDGANFAAVYALDTNEGNWASKGSAAFRLMGGPGGITARPTSQGAVWMFTICGGEADNDTLSFDVVGWAQGNGMAQVVCTGDAVIGTQDVVLYPDDGAAATSIWWADTINVDATTPWPGVGTYNNGNNGVAMLLIDTAGLEYLQFVVYDAGGTGTEANDVTVYGRPY